MPVRHRVYHCVCVTFEILYIDLPGSLILVLIRVVYVGVTVVALVIYALRGAKCWAPSDDRVG